MNGMALTRAYAVHPPETTPPQVAMPPAAQRAHFNDLAVELYLAIADNIPSEDLTTAHHFLRATSRTLRNSSEAYFARRFLIKRAFLTTKAGVNSLFAFAADHSASKHLQRLWLISVEHDESEIWNRYIGAFTHLAPLADRLRVGIHVGLVPDCGDAFGGSNGRDPQERTIKETLEHIWQAFGVSGCSPASVSVSIMRQLPTRTDLGFHLQSGPAMDYLYDAAFKGIKTLTLSLGIFECDPNPPLYFQRQFGHFLGKCKSLTHLSIAHGIAETHGEPSWPAIVDVAGKFRNLQRLVLRGFTITPEFFNSSTEKMPVLEEVQLSTMNLATGSLPTLIQIVEEKTKIRRLKVAYPEPEYYFAWPKSDKLWKAANFTRR